MTARPYTDALGNGAYRAMPSARAATPAGLSRLRRLRAGIASLSRIDCTADANGDGAQLTKPATIIALLVAIASIAVPTFAASWFAAALISGPAR